jgi:hypothetical protein
VEDQQIAIQLTIEGRTPCQDFKQNHSQRVDIALPINLANPTTLLGRHIERSSHDHVRFGLHRRRDLRIAQQLGDPKVEQLHTLTQHSFRIAIRNDHHVVWLQVSVNSITVEKQSALVPRKRRALNRPGNGLQSADPDQRPLPMLPKQA